MSDHLHGAKILAHDVVADRPQLREIDRLTTQDFLHRFGVAENGGERLVHLVRNGRGELPQHRDASHVSKRCPVLIRLLLGELAGSDVERHAEQPLAVPSVIRAAPRDDPAHLAIGPKAAVLDVQIRSVGDGPTHGVLDRFAIRGMHSFQCLTDAARRGARRFGRPEPIAGRVPNPHRELRRSGGERHTLFALLQRGCRLSPQSPLDQQGGDQPGLNEKGDDGDDRGRAVCLPERRLPEMPDGSRGNLALCDPPSARLTPVDV